MTTIEYRVTGITCASCAAIIQRTLQKIDGIREVAVNIATEMARVTFVDGEVDLNRMNDLLSTHGYAFRKEDVEENDGPTVQEDRKAELDALRVRAIPAMIAASVMFLVMISEIILGWAGMEFPIPMEPWKLVQFGVAALVLFGTGGRFFAGIWRFVRHGRADMNTLVGIGTTVAFLYSAFILLAPSTRISLGLSSVVYFDATIVVIGFVLFGKFLEIRSKMKTGEAIEALMQLQATTAHVEREGGLVDIPLEEVRTGDICVVKVGEKIPVDGIVLKGKSHIDESMITGESVPVSREVGDSVIGSTMNTAAVLTITATAVGEGTVLSQIIRLVEEAQGSKARVQQYADTISAYFVPTVLVISVLTLILWLVIGSPTIGFAQALPLAITSFIGILVIACPCALGLATPTAIIVSTGTAARSGLLIKNAEALERAHKVNTVVFDKTGTLTEGRPVVTDIVIAPDAALAEDQVLQYAASIEQFSSHPLGAAIVRSAKDRSCPAITATDAHELAGQGIKAMVNGSEWAIGTWLMQSERDVQKHPVLAGRVEALQQQGKTVVHLAQGTSHIALIALADVTRGASAEGIQTLQRLGVRVVMLTGDNKATATLIANQLGISEIIAEVKPDQKAGTVRQLQEEGRVVAMVGDGINDAPALAQADVGIAMSSGTDVAIESADITVLHGDIRKVALAIGLSKRTIRTIKQNLFWAFFYNVLGIPIAAGVLFPLFGIMLNPAFAGMAMAFSSVSVLANSLRLRAVRR